MGSTFLASQGASWIQYVQELERQSKKANGYGLHDEEGVNTSYMASTESSSDNPDQNIHDMTQQAMNIGYQRARRMYNESKDIKFIMQASPCKTEEDFLDLEVTEQGL